MTAKTMILSLAALVSVLAPNSVAQERLVCCGWDEVFIVQLGADGNVSPETVWSWKASDSPKIPQTARKTFASTDECKPIGTDFILITSSSGGVALISRKDKQCHFYTQAKNAHSACLVSDYRVAVASSFGGDELLIYKLEKPNGKAAAPVARLPLRGAHGAVWDKKRDRLWALGTDELLLIEVEATKEATSLNVEKRISLPTPGGHDLSQCADETMMFVSTDNHVYRFNKALTSFVPVAPLADSPKVKSITEHPQTHEIVYHQGSPDHWWSDTIRFLSERSAIQLEGRRLYKIRWDTSE